MCGRGPQVPLTSRSGPWFKGAAGVATDGGAPAAHPTRDRRGAPPPVACRIDDLPVRSDPATLSRLADLELVARYQAGSEDALAALLGRYRRFARAKARGYFLVGADRD